MKGAFSNIIEYILISSILLIFMVILLTTLNPLLIEGPMDQLTRHAYIDIGNGVSTRMVDLYIIAPDEGNIKNQV